MEREMNLQAWDPVEAGFIGPDGDNNRDSSATLLQVTRQENAVASHINLLLSVYHFLNRIRGLYSIQMILHYYFVSVNIFNGGKIPNFNYFMKCIYLTCLVIFVIIEIMTYYMYDVLETSAFKQYEKIFPSSKYGLGDAPRLQFFSWSEFYKKVWQQRKNIKKTLMNNKMSIFKIVCALVFLCDLNHAINEMYMTYRELPFLYRTLFIGGPLIWLGEYFEFYPAEITNLLLLDNITNIIIFPNYTIPGPPIIFSTNIWIFRTICLWYFCTKVQEIKRQEPMENFRPDVSRVSRILASRLEGNNAQWRVESARMFSRWCAATRIVEGRREMTAHVRHMQEQVRQLWRDNNVDEAMNLIGEGHEF